MFFSQSLFQETTIQVPNIVFLSVKAHVIPLEYLQIAIKKDKTWRILSRIFGARHEVSYVGSRYLSRTLEKGKDSLSHAGEG